MIKKLSLLQILLIALVSIVTAQKQPVKVELIKHDSGYQLMRGGSPYYILGAGGGSHASRLASYGGNSMRTWSTRGAEQILDSAHRNGLTVLLGLHVGSERHGFDYNDKAAVKKQLDGLRQEVRKFKDHPALLAWGIGNELNLHYSNTAVWDAVNDIARMIHEEDKMHPVATILAGVNKDLVSLIKTKCPDIDLLGINVYAPLENLPAMIRNAGWDGAYMVTEWGPTGHWEGLLTSWKRPIEETSSEKAAVYKRRYEYSMNRDRQQCIGSYVFLWGQKQERTPTWYGMFTEQGEESEVIDVMQFLWSGKWPENRAPHLYSLQLDRKKATDNIILKAGSRAEALVNVMDPDNDSLNYRWELLAEPTKVGEGGDREDRPATIRDAFTGMHSGKAVLHIPTTPGEYRIFVYVTDGNNNVATANIPFLVQ